MTKHAEPDWIPAVPVGAASKIQTCVTEIAISISDRTTVSREMTQRAYLFGSETSCLPATKGLGSIEIRGDYRTPQVLRSG